MEQQHFEFINNYKGSKAQAARILAEKIGANAESIRVSYNRQLKREKHKPIEEPVFDEQAELKRDIEKSRDKGELLQVKRKYNAALKEIENMQISLSEITTVRNGTHESFHIPYESSSSKGQATPVVMISDIHAEETVQPDVINSINEYSLDICQKRLLRLFQNSQKLVNKERSHVVIDDIIVWFGGDMITGYIHEELEEGNGCSPTEAIRFVKRLLIAGIEFYLKHGNYKNITVVCNYGNHGRTTKKKRVSTGYKNSYEYMMYLDISDYFKNENRVHFVVAKGIYAYVHLYDKYTLRFFHGDHVRFQGGVGGITIPVNKMLAKVQKQQHADYNFMAHFHSFFEVANNCVCNGSVIGYGPYAQSISADPEEPVQDLYLLIKNEVKQANFLYF